MIGRTDNAVFEFKYVRLGNGGLQFTDDNGLVEHVNRLSEESKQKILDELFTTGKVDLRKYQ